MQRDVRAVENPISAMFDLSEDVASQAPTIRSLVRYASAFILVWLFINVILGLALLANGALFLALVMLCFFVIGLTSLILLYRINHFFKYFVARQRAINSVRNMDPMIYTPQGNTATERLLTYLRMHVAGMLGKNVEVAMPGIVQGQRGTQYSFDAYVKEPSGTLWKLFGVGKHGFAIYVKRFNGPPAAEDLQALKKAVEDVSIRTRIPPIRVIALWERGEKQNLSDASYQYITGNSVNARHKFRKMACSMEIVSESGGTYDFIPYMPPLK
jgi:hypothetical protein